MRGDACNADEIEVEVLVCNWHAVQTYMRCQPTMLAGMSGAVILGVSASEAMASARMLRVPERKWPSVIDGAQALASMVAKIENEKSAARQQRKR
jgi:hypothetical protein